MVQTRSQAANAQGKKKIPAPKRTKLQEDDDDESEDEQQAPAVPKTKAAKKAKLPKSPVKNSSAPAPVMSARIIGQVDPEFAQKKGSETTVACDDDDHLYDAMLCMVEGTSDKYYVLQVIEYDDKYVCFARWGRTGAKGQQQTLGPFTDLSEAVAAFEDKFTEKTGNTWSDFVEGGFKHQKGKYDCLVSPISGNVQAARAAGVEWEYEVTDRVNGKANGWYAYDVENGDQVEAIYQAWKDNPQSAMNLSQRTISSDSSGYQYAVDLINMTQTNVSTKKTRAIRRVNDNGYVIGS